MLELAGCSVWMLPSSPRSPNPSRSPGAPTQLGLGLVTASESAEP